MNIKGKEYLQVAHRIVWFLEETVNWRISTKLISLKEDSALFRAMIRNEQGHVMATAHKFETKSGFPDFVEKAETGAIGRALAYVGYGTQFTGDELDEGERLADSPTPSNTGYKPKEPLKNYAPMPTQDDEMPDFNEPPWDDAPTAPPPTTGKPVSEAQIKRLWAIANKSGWQNFQTIDHMQKTYKIARPDQLNRNDYDSLISYIEQNPKKRA